MLSFSNINLLLSSSGSGGESGDDDGGDDGSYDGLTGYCRDENVGDGHARARGRNDKAVVPFVDYLERYSFVDSF
ncbi:hypothetical protein [Paenibacillus sp. cl141a]|uniref:hypothetical protein n=1 Tax=Paenibacillus sp. cl141a TaxID=1761877 RepID=UPI00158791EC|nr:hypothetical protein [Paenibacillus sp. cl141a]